MFVLQPQLIIPWIHAGLFPYVIKERFWSSFDLLLLSQRIYPPSRSFWSNTGASARFISIFLLICSLVIPQG